MRKVKSDKQEAILELRKIIKPGTTVYTVLRHVSRSGMVRGIDLYVIRKNEPRWITGQVGKAIDCQQTMRDWKNGNGLRVSGCGMDMGFHLVYSLGRVLFPKGFVPSKAGLYGRNGEPNEQRDDDGGYALKHRWL